MVVTAAIVLTLVPAAGASATRADRRPASGPDLEVALLTDAPRPLAPSEGVVSTISVTNVGDATAHGIEIVDELGPGLRVVTVLPELEGGTCTVTSSALPSGREDWNVTCRRRSLGAGETTTVVFEVAPTEAAGCGPTTNLVTAIAEDEPRGAVDEGNVASDEIDLACGPSVSIEVTGPPVAHPGDAVTVTSLVTNRGATDLVEIEPSIPACADGPTRLGDEGADAVLSPGQAWRYRCSHVPRSGDPSRITARVRATDGTIRLGALDRFTIDVLHPALDLRVSVDGPSGTVGGSLAVTYVVENVGDAPLVDLVVADEDLGRVGTIAQLAPGRRASLRGRHLLRAQDPQVTIAATVTGADPLGLEAVSRDAVSIAVVAADEDEQGRPPRRETAFTGGDATVPAALAIALLLLGLGARSLGRRRSA
jgi:hypothetical protein